MKNDKKLLLALLIFIVFVCSLLIVQNNKLKKKCTVAFSTTKCSDTFSENTYISDIAPSANQKAEFPCDINLVSKETLMEIDGIGAITAEKIITYRDNINGFQNLEQLLDIDGIGNATYEKLKKYLYIGSAVTGEIEKIAKTTEITTMTVATKDTTIKTTTTQKTEPVIIEEKIEYPININTASQKLLMELPGIGQVKATAIISFRETYGYFNHSDEIMNVKGIGQATYDKLKNLITTGTYQSDIPSFSQSDNLLIVTTTSSYPEVIIATQEPEETLSTTVVTQPTMLVNINTATKEDLIAYLSLTAKEAEAIVTHREKTGHNFTSKDELLLFISTAKYNSIYNMITL